MEIIIFTDNKDLEQLFIRLQMKIDSNISIYPIDKLDESIKVGCKDKYLYIDIFDFNQKKINEIVKKAKKENLNVAFIDLKAKIKDPAGLIFNGIFDYFGKDLIKKFIRSGKIDASRIESAVIFRANQLANINLKREDEELKRELGFCSNWKDIKEGKEYLFWILLISVEDVDRLKESMSNEYKNYLFSRFKEFVKRVVKSGNGRIWIWNEHGGVVLFPYDGAKIDAVASSIRLILNRKIFNFELRDSYDLNYRIALHKGKTVYRERGKTGTIVSDDINKIFHIGLDFAQRPGLYLTDSAMELLPEKALIAFENLGSFEGVEIFKFHDFVK